MHLNLQKPLVFFDLETTGLNIVQDRIVELAFIKIQPNGQRSEFVKKINPEMPIPAASTAIHGIGDQDVAEAPTFREVAGLLLKFLEGCDLAGFNILKFDIPVLVEEFLRVDQHFDLKKRRMIDLQKIFYIMEPRTLQAALRFYCNQELENAHSALADTEACLQILEEQVRRYEGVVIKDPQGKDWIPVSNDMASLHKLSIDNKIDLAGRLVYDDKGFAVFNFGKYKGTMVQRVFEQDPSYYDWMMKGDFALNTKQKLTELKLSMLKR